MCHMGIIPFGMILRMELKVNFYWKVLQKQRSRLCVRLYIHFSLVGQKMC